MFSAYPAPLTLAAPEDILPCPPEKCPNAIKNLPVSDLHSEFLPIVARLLIVASAIVAFLVFIVTGTMLVFSWGTDENIKRAKSAIVWSSIGLVLIAFAYALVRTVLQIDFDSFV